MIRNRTPSFDNQANKVIVRRPSMSQSPNSSPTTPPAIVQSSSNPEVFGHPSGVSRRGSFSLTKEICCCCHDIVYITEKVVNDGRVYHKQCFRCEYCHSTLGLGNYHSLNGLPYCHAHYIQLFQLKGNYHDGFGQENPTKNWKKTSSSSCTNITPRGEREQNLGINADEEFQRTSSSVSPASQSPISGSRMPLRRREISFDLPLNRPEAVTIFSSETLMKERELENKEKSNQLRSLFRSNYQFGSNHENEDTDDDIDKQSVHFTNDGHHSDSDSISSDITADGGTSPRHSRKKDKKKRSPLTALAKINTSGSSPNVASSTQTSVSSTNTIFPTARRRSRHNEEIVATVHNPIFRKFIPKNANTYQYVKTVEVTTSSPEKTPEKQSIERSKSPLKRITPLRFSLLPGRTKESDQQKSPLTVVTNPIYGMKSPKGSDKEDKDAFPSSPSSASRSTSPRKEKLPETSKSPRKRKSPGKLKKRHQSLPSKALKAEKAELKLDSGDSKPKSEEISTSQNKTGVQRNPLLVFMQDNKKVDEQMNQQVNALTKQLASLVEATRVRSSTQIKVALGRIKQTIDKQKALAQDKVAERKDSSKIKQRVQSSCQRIDRQYAHLVKITALRRSVSTPAGGNVLNHSNSSSGLYAGSGYGSHIGSSTDSIENEELFRTVNKLLSTSLRLVSGCKKDSNHKQRVLDRIKNDAIFRSQTSDYHHSGHSYDHHPSSTQSSPSSSGIYTDGQEASPSTSSSHSPSPPISHTTLPLPKSPSATTLPQPLSSRATAPVAESVSIVISKLPPLSPSASPTQQSTNSVILPLLPPLSPQRSPTGGPKQMASVSPGRLTSSSPRLITPLLSELPPAAFHSSPVIKKSSPHIAT